MINRQIQIILADDDSDDQYFLQEAIKRSKLSHRVTVVFDGRELIDLLEEDEEMTKAIDLIVLDINMPQMGGIEALTKIKSNPAWGHIPVVMLSTSSDVEQRENCIKLGANGFFIKPLDVVELDFVFEDIRTNILNIHSERIS